MTERAEHSSKDVKPLTVEQINAIRESGWMQHGLIFFGDKYITVGNLVYTIDALTTRAEQAERERDEAEKRRKSAYEASKTAVKIADDQLKRIQELEKALEEAAKTIIADAQKTGTLERKLAEARGAMDRSRTELMYKSIFKKFNCKQGLCLGCREEDRGELEPYEKVDSWCSYHTAIADALKLLSKALTATADDGADRLRGVVNDLDAYWEAHKAWSRNIPSEGEMSAREKEDYWTLKRVKDQAMIKLFTGFEAYRKGGFQ